MAIIRILIFVLISIWLMNIANGQDPVVENPLQDFLNRLSDPTLTKMPPVKLSGHGGPRGKYQGFQRSQGKLGVSGITGETERRMVWNRGYVAQLKKVGQEKWSCQAVTQSGTDAYLQLFENANLAGCFFGPMIKRLQVLEFVRVNSQSDGSLYEYRYPPDCPVYSSDPVQNSLLIRFDRNSNKARIVEIKHWEGGGETKIESITKFDYPKDSFFPLKRIGKAVVNGGAMDGTEIVMEDVVEIDSQVKFDPAECYLGYYGLPEPIFPSNGFSFNQPIVWIVAVFFLVLCSAFLGPRYFRAKAEKHS